MKEKSNFKPFGNDTPEPKKWQIFHFAVLFLLCLSALSAGCASYSNLSGPGGGGGEIIDKFELSDAKFNISISEQNGLLPTDSFWFSSFDTEGERRVVYGWNTAFLQIREADVANCNYTIPTGGCRQCDFCVRVGNAVCNNNTSVGYISQSQHAALFESSDQSFSEQIVSEFTRPDLGCLMRQVNPPTPPPLPSFVADKDATYTLRKTFEFGSVLDLAALKTTMVRMPRLKTEVMEPYADTNDPALRFRFKMPESNGKLRENFSPNLKITKVRVLLGTKDPISGTVMTKDDSESLQKVRPSRILFLPDFREGNVNNSPSENVNRCYFDATKDDGDFNMQTCRYKTDGTIAQYNATPTYLFLKKSETLTWLVEYKTADGLQSVPTFAANEIPVLEFTIE